MICSQCARAADQRAPRSAHCADPKCMCGHRVDRYGKTTIVLTPFTAGELPTDQPPADPA